jgi:hypothetical protein
MRKQLLPIASFLLFPALAMAQTLGSMLGLFTRIINALMPFIVALAVLFFMIGVFQFVRAPGDDDRTEGRNRMIYGIIGIFVMVSIWGFVNLLAATFRLDSTYIPPLPTFPLIG